ncbi:MAG: hypothetical protein AAF974_04675, partial [Cyanobacteria bacterium P01_E01_bin.34]
VAIVSQSIEFLKKLATHKLCMDKGSVKMFGPTNEVLDSYAEFSQQKLQSKARVSRNIKSSNPL